MSVWPAAVEWIVRASLQAGVLALVVLAAERLFGDRLSTRVRAAAWWAVLMPFVLPLALPQQLAPAVLVDLQAVSEPGFTPLVAFALVSVLACAWFAIRRARELRRLHADTRTALQHSALVARLAAELNLGRAPEIRVGEQGAIPCVAGWLRPIVVVPDHLSDAALEHALLHELVHVRRRDPLLALVRQLAQALLWFHPAVWIARRRLALLCELACDAEVAQHLGARRTDYLHTLLTLAVGEPGAPRAASSAVLGMGSAIVARVEALARPARTSRAWSAPLVFVVLLACCVPLRVARPAAIDPGATGFGQFPGCMQNHFAVLGALARESGRP